MLGAMHTASHLILLFSLRDGPCCLHFTDKETEAQRVEVTCPTCHGHETAKQSVSWFSRLPGQRMAFWLGWGGLLSMVGTRM